MLLVLPALLVLACDDQGPWGSGIRPLESKVVFGFSELHEPYNDPAAPLVLRLQLATETAYPCCNWWIATEHTLRPTGGRVELQGIFVSETCLTAIGPANAWFPWSLPNGRVPLQFVHGMVTDTYALQVTDSTIAISQADGKLTRPGALLFRRPPR
jgi:hypothetical protein